MRRGKLRFPAIFPRSFTLMFVPHSRQSIFRFKIPALLVKLALVSVICLSLLVAYCTSSYLNMKENMDELRTLRTVNKKQKVKLKNLEKKTENLQEKMTEVKDLEKDVRVMLQDGELASRAVGGPSREEEYPRASRGGELNPLVAGTGDKSGSVLESDRNFRGELQEWDQKYTKLSNSADSLSTEAVKMQEKLSELKKDVADKKAYLAARPSGLPVAGHITCGYGNRRHPVTGRVEFHPALDIAASYGAPVVATGKGRVIHAGYRSGYGKTVIINHGYGFRTLYSHNSKLLVRVGETVTRGERIALLGSTGTSTGPHVHYEVILHGANKNPAQYLY